MVHIEFDLARVGLVHVPTGRSRACPSPVLPAEGRAADEPVFSGSVGCRRRGAPGADDRP